MDKQEAIKRLDALDAEAKKLREIIERGDKLTYIPTKLYVGVNQAGPALLAGEGDYFRFQHFSGYEPTICGMSHNARTAQRAIDTEIFYGNEVHAFSDRFEGMKFFYDAYMAGKKG